MFRIITVISFGLLLSACASGTFSDSIDKKRTVVRSEEIVYPSLPDIDKPIPPVLRTVVFDYPRDSSKPKQAKATSECHQQPPIPNFDSVCLEYPLQANSNIFIGMNSESFKNYITNQELLNSYNRMLLSRIDEINSERQKWRDSNKPKDLSNK
jgi:hypothetical protein